MVIVGFDAYPSEILPLFGTGNPKFDAPLLQGPRCSVSGFEMKPTPRMAAMALKNSDRCHSSWPDDDDDVNRRDFMRSLRKNGSEDRDSLMGFYGILWDNGILMTGILWDLHGILLR